MNDENYYNTIDTLEEPVYKVFHVDDDDDIEEYATATSVREAVAYATSLAYEGEHMVIARTASRVMWSSYAPDQAPEDDLACQFCGERTTDAYMVHDHVWRKAAGPRREGQKRQLLHLACLAMLLERELTVEDFTIVPINDAVLTAMGVPTVTTATLFRTEHARGCRYIAGWPLVMGAVSRRHHNHEMVVYGYDGTLWRRSYAPDQAPEDDLAWSTRDRGTWCTEHSTSVLG